MSVSLYNRVDYLLALESLEGVGKVSARKVADSFSSPQELRATPAEQALNRLKGVPNSADLLETLKNSDVMERALQTAQSHIQELETRAVYVIGRGDEGWPVGLESIPNLYRPNILFLYGDVARLSSTHVAVVASTDRDEMEPMSRSLIDYLVDQGLSAVASVAEQVDLHVMRSARESVLPVLVAGCGFARLPARVRADVADTVRAGGLLVSSFRLDHGPFAHDLKERSFLQTAISAAVVFLNPEVERFSWPALEWAVESKRAVFSIGGAGLPTGVHPIRNEIDFEWVKAALELDTGRERSD